MPVSRLIFFPRDPEQTVDYTRLTDLLDELQFIKPVAEKQNDFLPGDQFLSLLTFLGCSPNINLSPLQGEDHCRINLLTPSKKSSCLGYTRTARPKCPACTKRINNWETQNWKHTNTPCICDKCQTATPYARLNWKQECGFGCGGFEITHIYPHEAVPTEQLLESLKTLNDTEWLYCYANN